MGLFGLSSLNKRREAYWKSKSTRNTNQYQLFDSDNPLEQKFRVITRLHFWGK